MTDEANPAWRDDPSFAARGFEDEDSRRLIKGLSILFWPGGSLLIGAGLAIWLFGWGWAVRPWSYAGGVWILAHLMFRPRKFGAEAMAAALTVRDVFAFATRLFAEPLNALVTKLNRSLHAAPAAPGPQAFMAAGLADPLATTESAAREAAPAMRPSRRIDWLGLADGVLKFLPVIIVAALVLWASLALKDIFDGPSGKEVAAAARAANAESERRTSEAEARRSAESVVIVEDVGERRRRAQDQTEEAREAVARAPDLETRYAEYRTRAQRLRDESGAAVADAVREHTAGVAP